MGFDGKVYTRVECPFSTKVLVFLAEAKLLDTIELDEIDSRAALDKLKEESGKENISVPCLEFGGQFMCESDDIISFLCEKYDIEEEGLVVLATFRRGIFKDYLRISDHLNTLVQGHGDDKVSSSNGWFKHLDKDGDGLVDLDELLDGLEATRYLADARQGFKIQDSKWTAAVAQIDKLIEENPKLTAVHRLKMELATISDQYEMFFQAADSVLQLVPGDPQSLLLKAAYARSLGKSEEFAACMRQLEKASPCAARAAKCLVSTVEEAWKQPPTDSIPEDVKETISILALGSPANEDGSPQPRLLGTLNATLTAARMYPNAKIFCTGAAVSTSMPEAIAMKRWLIQNGVEKERIILEMKARDTVGNYVNIAPYLRENHVSKTILVTVYYHLNRSAILADAVFKQQGLAIDVMPLAGKSDLFGEHLQQRMHTERAASFRDLARAWHLYEAKDFAKHTKDLNSSTPGGIRG